MTPNRPLSTGMTRRRAFTLIGTWAGMGALLPPAAWASSDTASPTPFRWTGQALGAKAEMILYHPNKEQARRLVSSCVDEIERLENIFSLYRTTSELARLNRSGRLDRPSHDMLRLLGLSGRYFDLSGGAFDPSVQPLWQLYSSHFSRPGTTEGPRDEDIRKALKRVGFAKVDYSATSVSFSRPGMGLTFNGIAQGYITDRIADILKENGLDRVLVNLGEIRAIGPAREDGTPWRIGLSNAGGNTETVDLKDLAIATSSGGATRFDPEGRYHHLFDPRIGRSAGMYSSISVTAPLAADADALSTALSSLDLDQARDVLSACPGTAAIMSYSGEEKTTRI